MKKILTLAAAFCLCAISSKSQVILQDNFNYGASGVATNASGNVWVRHSGTGNDCFINNNRLEIFGTPTRADDINRVFTTAASTATNVLFASFIVNSTNFNNGQTNYFAHFKDSGTQNFKCRIFTVGNQASAANSWRLGIANAAGAASTAVKIYPQDLATNVDYKVVISYDTNLFLSTLWIDPVSPADLSISANDGTTGQGITAFAFRQSSPGQALRIDDLYIGNFFQDVAVGTPKPAVVYYQPNSSVLVFSGNSTNLYCVGAGAGVVSFQWQHAGTNLIDDANTIGSTSNVLALTSSVVSQTGNYRCIVTSTTNGVLYNSATSAVSVVTVSQSPIPPAITVQPVNQSVFRGQTAIFSVAVNGPGTITYQWKSNNVDLVGETGPTLTLNNVQTNLSGTLYRVGVTNEYGGVLSSNASLTVANPNHVSIAFLRRLVDASFQATNTTTPYEVTGIVTTFTNITTGNTSSYYLQDGTAGINIFATFGSTFRPAQGDQVTFVGVTSSFSSGLELFADTVNRTYTSYTIDSSGNTLPAARTIPFNVTNVYGLPYVATNLAGSRVSLTNVYFGTNFGATISTTANQSVNVTNAAGQTFILNFFFVDLDTAGQTLPEYATTVTGILYGNHPNYSLAVTKFSDIVAGTPTVTPIPLTTSLSGSTLTISWSSSAFYLQSATNVAGPYIYVPDAVSPFTTNVTSPPIQFFRLTSEAPVPPG